jgi:transcription antitermination factor NusB
MYQVHQSGESVEGALVQFKEWVDLSAKGGADHQAEDGQPSGNAAAAKRAYVHMEFVRTLTTGAWANMDAIDTKLQAYVETSLDRVPLVLHCILRLAIYELLFESTPHPVVINEYIEISKDFFNEDEQAFVNGVLDAISKDMDGRNTSETGVDAKGHDASDRNAAGVDADGRNASDRNAAGVDTKEDGTRPVK